MSGESILNKILCTLNLSKSNPQISGIDSDIMQLKCFINQAGVEACSRARWQKLLKKAVTGGNITQFVLPNDYQQMPEVSSVFLNKPTYNAVRQVNETVLWGFLRANPSNIPYYYIADNKIEFSPQIDGDGVVIDYYSKNWVVGDKVEITQNSEESLIPDVVIEKGAIWRWKREKGLPYSDEMAEFEAVLASENGASRGLS